MKWTDPGLVEVSTPPANPIATVEEAIARVGGTSVPQAQQDALQGMLDAAEGYVEGPRSITRKCFRPTRLRATFWANVLADGEPRWAGDPSLSPIYAGTFREMLPLHLPCGRLLDDPAPVFKRVSQSSETVLEGACFYYRGVLLTDVDYSRLGSAETLVAEYSVGFDSVPPLAKEAVLKLTALFWSNRDMNPSLYREMKQLLAPLLSTNA